jgi:alpha-amylase
MYFSRGNPVVYYGDEQGFTGGGGDQLARQTMFASQVPDYLDDDLLGTTRTHATSSFEPSHPLYQAISGLAQLTEDHPALRDGAQQSRTAGSGEAGAYAFSRLDRTDQHEYVVALNNSESTATASFQTFVPNGSWTRLYGGGAATETTDGSRTMSVSVPALSAVVYRSDSVIPTSTAAPDIDLFQPEPSEESRGRMHVQAAVDGSSFYEVTFYAKHGSGPWQAAGTDDSAPYQVYDDVSSLVPGTKLKYRAVVLDNAGNTSVSKIEQMVAPEPKLTIEVPAEGAKVRGTVEVRAVADPERADHVVTFERSVDGGAFTQIGTDDSSPVYTVFDDVDALDLAEGTPITYRATLHYVGGGTVSATRTVQMAGPPPTMATLRYFRPAGDYGEPPGDGWGLHMWGEAVDPTVLNQIAWDNPWPRTSVVDGWAVYEIPLVDATKPVNFIMHLPGGDSVPATREPGGDRSFVPLESPEVWIKQGDPTVYTSEPNAP